MAKTTLTFFLVYSWNLIAKYWQLLFFAAVILISLSSCSPQHRMQNLMDKHPDLISYLVVRDTVRIPEVKGDTTFLVSHVRDTIPVVYQKERLVIRYQKVGDTIKLSGECKDSVIVREIPGMVVTKYETKERVPLWMWGSLIVVGAIIVIMTIRRIFK